nr:ATP synthase F0 subunit 8 [Callimenellus fumidus]
MSPMSWTTLFTIFTLMLLLIFVINYTSTQTPTPNLPSHISMSISNHLNWKW